MANISAIQPILNTNETIQQTKESESTGFSSYLSSGSVSMDEIFNEASSTYGVPENLLKAIAKQESNFNPQATSRCGAQGVMQLMPKTAASLGVTDAYDPYQNIMGGAKYIRQMLDKYNGDTSLALAAYNAGSGNVAKYGGIPPFKETQNYVVKVTQYMNQDISVPTASYAIDRSTTVFRSAGYMDSTTLSESFMDQIFSYDDYLKLLTTMLTSDLSLDLNGDDKKESEAEHATTDSDSMTMNTYQQAYAALKKIEK